MTEKRARKLLRRMYFHYERLANVLNEAHNAGLIVYPQEKYKEDGPCASLWECRERFEKTTKTKIADLIQSQIRNLVR